MERLQSANEMGRKKQKTTSERDSRVGNTSKLYLKLHSPVKSQRTSSILPRHRSEEEKARDFAKGKRGLVGGRATFCDEE